MKSDQLTCLGFQEHKNNKIHMVDIVDLSLLIQAPKN